MQQCQTSAYIDHAYLYLIVHALPTIHITPELKHSGRYRTGGGSVQQIPP